MALNHGKILRLNGVIQHYSWGGFEYIPRLLDIKNEKGIPLNAAHRNYKDPNHKPEMMIALGDFWLLHGFKNQTSLKNKLDSVPELAFLSPIFSEGSYRALYERVMFMDQQQVNEI